MPTNKQISLDHICEVLGLEELRVSVGSSVPSAMFLSAARQFGLDPSGSMPVIGRRIVEAADLVWDEGCDSTHTPSKGGSTVTSLGMERLASAIDILAAEQHLASTKVGAVSVGTSYIVATGGIEADPVVVEKDWEALDRATSAHADTQNAIAAWLDAKGVEPQSPLPGGPLYDIGWWGSGGFVVCEVKTTTKANQIQQARLGLGQVLEYRDRLQAAHVEARAALVTDHALPKVSASTCASVQVATAWLSTLDQRLSPLL